MSEIEQAVAAARRRIESEIIPRFGGLAVLRLALHDALTYDSTTKTGACGTVRLPKVLAYQANEGLAPVAAALEALRSVAPSLSVADTIHLAGAVAVEALGGPAVAPPEARLPSFQSCMADPRRLLACLRRAGLGVREAAALAGAHPFGRWWSSPAAFESLHGSMEVLDSGDFSGSGGPAGSSPRASSRGEAPKPVPAFDASVFQEILEGQDPLSRHLADDPQCRQAMQQFAANEGAWREAYALAFQRLSEAATDLPPPRGASTGAGASWVEWVGLDVWSDGALAAAVVGAAAAVGAGVWWAARQRRLRRVPLG